MADLTVNHLNTATRDSRMRGLVDNIWTESLLFSRLKARGNIKFQSGENFEIPIEYTATTNARAYSRYASKNYRVDEFATLVKYSRKFYDNGIIIYDRDIDANSGPDKIFDIISNTVRRSFDGLRNKLAEDLYRIEASDPDPENVCINSLEDLFTTTVSTAYGDLAPNQFSGWVAKNSSAYTLDTLTSRALINFIRTIYTGIGRSLRPTAGYTTQTIWNSIEANEDDKQRGSYQNTLSLGAEYIMVDGIPIFVDDFQNAGYLDFLNEDFFHLFIHTNDNFKMSGWKDSEEKHGKVAVVTTTAQTGCTRRDCHGRLSGLS